MQCGVQLLPDRTCEGDGVGAERARGGQGVPVLAVPGRVPEERLGRGGEGQETEAAAAAGVGEGDVERGRERGEEVEQGQAQQLGLQHRGAPHAHRPPHATAVPRGRGGSGRAVRRGGCLALAPLSTTPPDQGARGPGTETLKASDTRSWLQTEAVTVVAFGFPSTHLRPMHAASPGSAVADAPCFSTAYSKLNL